MFTSTIRLFIPPRPTPEPGVPLGVWASPLDLPQGDAAAPPWLSRLIAEYTPTGQPVDLYLPGNAVKVGAVADQDSVPCNQAPSPDTCVAEARPLAGLVVALLHQPAMSAEGFGLHVSAAAEAVDAGGRLATVTRPGLSTRRSGRYDPISQAIDITAGLGFGYLQHLIIADPHQLARHLNQRRKPQRAGFPRHRTMHLDVPIFQAPDASPSRGDGQ